MEKAFPVPSQFFTATKNKLQDIKPAWFCIFWLAINLIQSAFTNLTSDEGYYWFFSRTMEWGYYDHPPLLALLVKMGYALFPNEFGTRLFPVLLNAAGVLFFLTLLPDKKKGD